MASKGWKTWKPEYNGKVLNMGKFDDALAFVLKAEGGYSNNKNDRGGATNKGITQVTYDKWRTSQMFPSNDVRWITDSEVSAIYRDNYWEAAHCDLLEQPMATIHFDSAVQHGPGRAIKFMQEACGLTVDGKWGMNTAKAAMDIDHDKIVAYLGAREDFYDDIVMNDSSQAVFMRGWLNRLSALKVFMDSGVA